MYRFPVESYRITQHPSLRVTAGFSFKTNQHKKLNAAKNIYFQDTPSIPLEIAH
jgi:hypothetical protein